MSLPLIPRLAGALLLGAAGWAQAALPMGTLEYVQRLGTASATDDIEVWMRFTLDPAGPGLRFSSNPLQGLDPADLPTTGRRFDPGLGQLVDVPFAPGSIHQALVQAWFGCSGNFVQSDCSVGAYSFVYDLAGSPSGDTSIDLDPGEVIEYRMLSFLPQGGAAPADTYRLPTSGLQIRFAGLDANGQELLGYHALGVACASGADDCAFTREVRAVPEPAVAALLLAGLAALRLGRRRG